MRDYHRLYNECVSELKAISITPGNVQRLVLGNVRDGWSGCCEYLGDDAYAIYLSYGLENERISDNMVKSVIIHELLHTVPGGFEHETEIGWESAADYVMAIYPQYNLRAYTEEEICDTEQSQH